MDRNTTDARATVERFLAALSAGDAATAVGLVADGFVNEHTSELGEDLTGRSTYAARLPAFLARFVGLRYEIVESVAEGARVVVRYRMTAGVDGHPIDIPGVMLFEIVDGLVARRTDVWDSLTFLRQTGIDVERR